VNVGLLLVVEFGELGRTIGHGLKHRQGEAFMVRRETKAKADE
jgi:hypothetical protein